MRVCFGLFFAVAPTNFMTGSAGAGNLAFTLPSISFRVGCSFFARHLDKSRRSLSSSSNIFCFTFNIYAREKLLSGGVGGEHHPEHNVGISQQIEVFVRLILEC